MTLFFFPPCGNQASWFPVFLAFFLIIAFSSIPLHWVFLRPSISLVYEYTLHRWVEGNVRTACFIEPQGYMVQ